MPRACCTRCIFGDPVDVLHLYIDGRASMQVKLGSIATMVDASGTDLDRAETVTLFNDMCVLAPAALIGAPLAWRSIDDRHVHGSYTIGSNTVRAELTFNDDGELVDFVSEDRLASSADGKTFTRQRWSTPVTEYRHVGARRIATIGEGRWHPNEGEFAYLGFHLDHITYNVTATTSP